MLHINIICIGKLKEQYLKDALHEYSKRLSKYCSLKMIELPDEKLPDILNENIINKIKNIESDNILSHIKSDSYTIALDLHGKQFSSEEFSSKIEDIALNKNSNINFIIGGTLGLSDKLLKQSSELICFSKMTFPHQLIRIFLLEQLFRAFKILSNEKYHH